MKAQILILSLILCIPGSLVWADAVELKTGQRVEGTFKQATSAGVVIEVGGQTITFEQEKVRAIYFGSGPSEPAPPSALSEALKALKALQSVTAGSVSYRDYAPRVSDTKIIVDRYLQVPERGDSEARKAVQAAIQYYVLASSAWNAKVARSDFTVLAQLGSDPAINRCPQAKQAVDDALKVSPPIRGTALPDSYWIGSRLANYGIPGLWSCASDKIAEAEQAMKMQEGSAKP